MLSLILNAKSHGVERCETKPSLVCFFFCTASSALTGKKKDSILFNFFEVTKEADFRAKDEEAESQKALFIVVTTTAGKEIF